MGRVTRLFEGKRLTRRGSPQLDVPPAPPEPTDLHVLSPIEVRRAVAEALHESDCLPGFTLQRSPAFVRHLDVMTHRIEVRAEGRYQVVGQTAPIDLIATVEHRGIKEYLFALSGINLRRPSIDPLIGGWAAAFEGAWRMIHEDWLPILDRFQGDAWLTNVRGLADPQIPRPGATLRLLLASGDTQAAREHLEWIAAVDDRLISWIREDFAKGPLPPGQARGTVGWQIAEPLRSHHCEALIDDL